MRQFEGGMCEFQESFIDSVFLVEAVQYCGVQVVCGVDVGFQFWEMRQDNFSLRLVWVTEGDYVLKNLN